MKVVLFCGGLGMRLREYSEKLPKPMVRIGYRPIIWHLMKYYAFHGHKEFILCLGYRGDAFKKYFLEYDECDSNDFTLYQGRKKVSLVNEDITDWTITFVDTGLHANIGTRLQAVRKYVEEDEMFLANYSDGLTDMNLASQLEEFERQDAVASFLSIKPGLSYHVVQTDKDGRVTGLQPFQDRDIRINGGFFAFRQEIFDYMYPGEELVMEPFYRLIDEQRLLAYKYDGFWGCIDTFKEKQVLDELYDKGNAPWEIWKDDAAQQIGTCTG